MGTERFTLYMGSEKFRPAEGFFAYEADTVIGYTDEYHSFSVGNYTVYLSPYFNYQEQTGVQDWDDLTPMIVAAITGTGTLDACVLVHFQGGQVTEGGATNSLFYFDDAGKDGVSAYQEGYYGYGDIEDVEYIKIYVYDYNQNIQGNEEWWDSHATLLAKLYPVYNSGEMRYEWVWRK